MYNISTMSDKSTGHLYHKYETLNLSKAGPGGIGGPLGGAGKDISQNLVLALRYGQASGYMTYDFPY